MKELPIEIEAHYPKQAVAGATYTMKADLSFDPEKISWPFDREEIPIYCMISTSLFTIKYPKSPIFLLHRYGGTYGQLTFFLNAVSEKKSGEVTIILLNDGMPVGHIDLKSEIIDIDVDRVKKIESREKVGLSRQKQHKFEEKYVLLVVEENEAVRELIRNNLEPFYTVVEARDGNEGIAKAKEIIPDLVISEIMIPGKDGYELCRELKKDIKTIHIPIIFLTVKASEESIIKGLETGVDDYITKPFNCKILLIRIKNLIDLRRKIQLNIQRKKMMMPSEVSVTSEDEKFLKELQEVIEKNLSDQDFGVDELSKKLIMGRSTLFRKIMALTGATPNQIILSYRLERAALLLRNNYGNVLDVAVEVGFPNPSYFSKCFKKKFHQYPSVYKASEFGDITLRSKLESKVEDEPQISISIREEKNVILVLEEHLNVRELIRNTLEPLFTVVEARDGKEGIAKAKEIIPDLIVSDILMPKADGYVLCQELKSDIKTSHIPIIFLTAKASDGNVIQGLVAGADDYMIKPFNSKILLARIKNLIAIRRQLQLKIKCYKRLLPHDISVSSMNDEFLKALKDIIEKNLSDPNFNVDALCKKLCLGRASLNKRLKALTGEMPSQFIKSYRLDRAVQLMKVNYGNINEIALAVGFSNTDYFAKCFKKAFHLLPSELKSSRNF